MSALHKSSTFGTAMVCALGIGLHQFFTAHTAARVPASLERIETRLHQIVPDVEALATPAIVDAAPVADPDATAARWKELFTRLRNRHGGLHSRWHAAMRMPLEVRWGGRRYNELSDNDVALLTGFVHEIDDVLLEIRELSQPAMPTCHFYSRKEPGRYSECELFLSADLLLATNTGDHVRAVDDILALTKMCDAYAYGGYPFRMHVGTQQSLRDAIASGAVDDSKWESLLQQLTRSRDHALFADAWARVAKQRLEWYGDLPESEVQSATLRNRARQNVLLYGYTYAAAPLKNRDVARYSDVMSELLSLARKPFYEVQPELNKIRVRYAVQPLSELHGWTDPGWSEVSTLVHERFRERAGVEAEIDLARMAILLERHRRESGNYPEKLDAIAAGLGGEIPLNPFLGDSYHYKRVDETFRLWYEDIGPAAKGGPDVRRAWIWPGEHEFPDPA